MNGIDLFAGAGGFTEGATQAGIRVIWAANHWPAAVQVHANNHPATTHVQQDLSQADFTKAPKHDILLASPMCTGHTPARGKDKPHHDSARSTAWAVVSCAEVHRSEFALIENVPEFVNWILFPAWRQAMISLGYHLTFNVFDAADFGVPQNRERLFILASKRKPIQIPNPRRTHVSARNILDLRSGRWNPIDKPGRSENTLNRISNARRSGLGDVFLTPYYSSGSGKTGRSIDRPLGTITTRDRFAIVRGDRMRMLTVSEYKAGMSFRPDYQLPECRALAIHLLGNAVPPLQAKQICQFIRSVA